MAAKKLKTLLVFVQDETGSMSGIQDQTIESFNEYFNTLKKDSKDFGTVKVQIHQFSADGSGVEQRVRPLHNGTLAKVPVLTKENYRPRGITPLLDAVGTAIRQAEGEKYDRYLFIVQTDGYENASQDFTREQIAKMVSEKEASDNWTVVFLGAGVAQWAQQVHGMGASGQTVSSYNPQNTPVAYAALASVNAAFLSSGVRSMPETGTLVQRKIDKQVKP